MTGKAKAELTLSQEERSQLQALARGTATLGTRARIVLGSAGGERNSVIAERLGLTRATVGKWRSRFIERRIAGLCDDVRPGKPSVIDSQQVGQLISAALRTEGADGSANSSVRSLAARTGISKSSVQRHLQRYGLQPPPESLREKPERLATRDWQAGQDPIFQTSDLLGDAWSWMILRDAIFDGVTRFDDFQLRLGVARKVLGQRLETLTTGGLFERRPVRQGSNHTEYVLTGMGRDFYMCLLTAQTWGDRWCGDRGSTSRHAVHVPSMHAFEATLCCSECGLALKARDVTITSIFRASSELISARRRRTPDLDLIERSHACSIARSQRVIGDRWSALVIRECFMGTRRFAEFEEHLGIASNILASRLNRLTDLGILVKTPYPASSARHEYRLTEMGLDFYAIPLSMLTWAEKWLCNGRSSTDLRHKPCGKRFTAVLACATCGKSVGENDVVIEHISQEDGQPA